MVGLRVCEREVSSVGGVAVEEEGGNMASLGGGGEMAFFFSPTRNREN